MRIISPGTLLHSRYRVQSVIGTGGVAEVYRATDEQLGRDVALKVIPHGAAGSAELRRVEDEVRLLAGFNHPALVTLYDVVSDDSGRFSTLVMQFVEGEDLSARIARGALPSGEVARIGATVAQALEFVHASGVIHRDVKPANILIPTNGPQPALLADFGIARLIDSAGVTATGTIIGTASYLSPEQARGAALSDRTDIYSLGLVLLEALSGTRAFPGSAVESVAARLTTDPAIPHELGPVWGELLERMIDNTPEARPSAADVQTALAAMDGPTATLVMPVADAATERLIPAVATERLTPVATAAIDRDPAPRSSRRGLIVIGALASVLAVVAIAFAASLLAGSPSAAPSEPTEPAVTSSAAPLPPISYPAVDGDLGKLLGDLQTVVGRVDDDEVARELGERVLAVTEAAAAGDFAAAQNALDQLNAAVVAAELTTADRDAITDASDAVGDELGSLIDDADHPGNGNGKPDKKP